ncbi:BTAD domain-containing putative transcriptional regulator [Streptomyces sp. NPDC005708]|uniref:BTAD domain-containing putative transcriptional regulator n=1 Tax=Streptomyces sp. NPDC005708 TaxID=3154564 RepID=UPI0033E54010
MEPARPRVIQRKIIPPSIAPEVVRRPRLEELLVRLIQRHQVVCVFATAGAGKTTALLQAAQRTGRPLAWLTADDTDTATGRLLTYLEAALVGPVPAVDGVATSALAARLSHGEVAGLLADAVGEAPVLLVIDDVERLAESPQALMVLSAFAQYTPDSMRLVLISRTELPFHSNAGASLPWVVAVGEDDLAFTVDEAAAALTSAGRPDIDPAQAIEVTGGWVTGVMFEAWSSADHVIGIGGEADPLHGYLAVQILDQLGEDERDFLIATAILDEVTAPAAEALGLSRAAQRLHQLRRRRLPVSWEREGHLMRAHPRFREYLLECLQRRGEDELRELRRAHGRLLIQQRHHEEAIEELLRAGALEEAASVAERVLEHIIERTDFALAKRWLYALEPVREQHPRLACAELLLLLAHEDYRGGAQLADQLDASGRLEEVVGASSTAASMIAWCYLHAGRLADMRRVVAAGRSGPELGAIRYCMTLLDEGEPERGWPTELLTGGPLDALVMRVNYYRGLLPLLAEPPVSPWAARAAESWRLGALLALGHIDEAYELEQAIREMRDAGVWLSALLQPRLLGEFGEHGAAWRSLLKGRERIRAAGSVMLELLSYVEEAELELRLNGDSKAARGALERLRTHCAGQTYPFVCEQADTWLGLALLLENDEAALTPLRRAVDSMRRSDRLLLLPAAAVYLAEAQWRAGEEEAADAAAELALSAADRQGSNHILLNALADFPAVLSRRLDAEPRADSSWHELGRALTVRGVQLENPGGAAVHLAEFGRIAIVADGEELARPRIKKSYELLAFLASRPKQEATRDEIRQSLFEGRTDESATAYLRQAVLKLRKVLPEGFQITLDGGRFAFRGHVCVTTDSGRLLNRLSEAADLRGEERMRALLSALEIVDRGRYLPGLDSAWIQERQEMIAALARDTRAEAAEIALNAGRYRLAGRLTQAVLAEDPYRESTWRLEMRIADALGDTDRVIAAFRSCEHALADLGALPSQSTRRLLDSLRR